MNRILIILAAIFLLGCDTSNNVTPIGEDYFLKFYGSLGDQQGVSVKETPDGGFIIGGNSIQDFGGTSDYLLIKVDGKGNQEWMQSYDFNGSLENDILKEVLVDNNSYVIAGTSGIAGVDKIILMRVGLDGLEQSRFIVQEANTFDYKCTGVTLAESGNLILVGSLESSVGISANGNSIFSVHDNDFNEIRITHSGNQGADITHVKGFEVLVPNTNIIQYLAVGFREAVDEVRIGFYLFDNILGTINSGVYENVLSTKAVDLVPVENDNFIILGASNDLSVFVSLLRENDNFRMPAVGKIIQSDKNVFIGNSLAAITSSEFAVSGNIIDLESTRTEASIVTSNSNTGIAKWQRFFGNEYNYTSGQTLVQADGSVVFVGTAGFKDQTKVFLIKMKRNGDMK